MMVVSYAQDQSSAHHVHPPVVLLLIFKSFANVCCRLLLEKQVSNVGSSFSFCFLDLLVSLQMILFRFNEVWNFALKVLVLTVYSDSISGIDLRKPGLIPCKIRVLCSIASSRWLSVISVCGSGLLKSCRVTAWVMQRPFQVWALEAAT